MAIERHRSEAIRGTPGSWPNRDLQLLGTVPDSAVAKLSGRRTKSVWAKRKALGIPAYVEPVQPWTAKEDQLVLSLPLLAAARALGRTTYQVELRRRALGRTKLRPAAETVLTLEEAKQRIEVPRYDSPEQEDRVRFVGGPYRPPYVPYGEILRCELRGELEVAGYSSGLIPWPIAKGRTKQFILCGDLVKALRTESRAAVSFHFGMSLAAASAYCQKRLGHAQEKIKTLARSSLFPQLFTNAARLGPPTSNQSCGDPRLAGRQTMAAIRRRCPSVFPAVDWPTVAD